MKVIKSIGLFFVMGMFCMLLGYLFGIQEKTERSPRTEINHEQKEIRKQNAENDEFFSFLDASANSSFLRSDTEFVIEEVDLRKGTVNENIRSLPDSYVGMDRKEFLNAMEEYAKAPPLSERKKGFLGLEVLSFSRERVVVQKNYRHANADEGFYIAVADYKIIVLLDDQKTLYMTTDISLQMLPPEMQEDLADMIFVNNEKELFDFLEAYSS